MGYLLYNKYQHPFPKLNLEDVDEIKVKTYRWTEEVKSQEILGYARG